MPRTRPAKLVLILALVSAVPASASPKPCRDANGRVITSPKPAKAAPNRCKDKAGRFIRCPTANVGHDPQS